MCESAVAGLWGLQASLQALQDSSIAMHIAGSTWLFPTIETLHVLALALTVGSIAMLDLRLMGLTWHAIPVQRLARQVIPWTWISFVVASTMGALLFISNAALYGVNCALQLKLLLLALAGINMTYFHVTTYRSVHAWGEGDRPPLRARVAGAVSLLLWGGVVAAGRWIGFTL